MSNAMNKKKPAARIFALIMAMMLCVGCFAVSSFAADEDQNASITINLYTEDGSEKMLSSVIDDTQSSWMLPEYLQTAYEQPGKELKGWKCAQNGYTFYKVRTTLSWEELVKIAGENKKIDFYVAYEAPVKIVYVSVVRENGEVVKGNVQVPVNEYGSINISNESLGLTDKWVIQGIVGDIEAPESGTMNVKVVEKTIEEPKEEFVYVSAVTPRAEVVKANVKVPVVDGHINISTTSLGLSDEWEILGVVGDIPAPESGTMNVIVGPKAPKEEIVYVSAVTESGDVIVANKKVPVVDGHINISNESLGLSDEWEIVGEVGDIKAPASGTMNVIVKKAETEPAPTEKEITVKFVDRDGNQVGKASTMTVAADATYVNSGDVTAPDGYEIGITGDITIDKDGVVTFTVDKIETPAPTTKIVKINYFDEVAYAQVAEVEMEVAADTTKVAATKLEAPEGYKIAWTENDYVIRDGYVYVKVDKIETPAPATKEVKLNYYDEKGKVQVAEPVIEVAEDANKVSEEAINAGLPEGYKIISCDYVIRDGYVYIGVEKEAVEPENPTTPVDPQDPTQPTTPADPSAPADTETKTDNATQTSDDFNMAPFAVAMVLAAGTAAVALKRRSSN